MATTDSTDVDSPVDRIKKALMLGTRFRRDDVAELVAETVALRSLVDKFTFGTRVDIEDDAMHVSGGPRWGSSLSPDEVRVLRRIKES